MHNSFELYVGSMEASQVNELQTVGVCAYIPSFGAVIFLTVRMCDDLATRKAAAEDVGVSPQHRPDRLLILFMSFGESHKNIQY